MNLYNIVTNDEYEIPVKCDLRVKEAAEFFGTSTNNIRRMISKPRKKSKYKVIISGKVEHDAKLYNKAYKKNRAFGNDVGCQEAFSREWEKAVYRLQRSRADLGKIRIVKNG